jgi:hypothetical protein
MRRTKQEAAVYIENFLLDRGGEWDWDDFTSIQIDDPELDQIRLRCGELRNLYPTEQGFCNEEGLEVLRGILKSLRG